MIRFIKDSSRNESNAFLNKFREQDSFDYGITNPNPTLEDVRNAVIRLNSAPNSERLSIWKGFSPSLQDSIYNAFAQTEVIVSEAAFADQFQSSSSNPLLDEKAANKDDGNYERRVTKCDQYKQKVEGSNPWFGVMWTYEATVYWCWDGDKISRASYTPQVWTSIFSPWTVIDEGKPVIDGGNGDDYYHLHLQGHLAVCLPEVGCFTPRYPWVDIWVYADGSRLGDHGGDGIASLQDGSGVQSSISV
jgi:hypothetical protein